MRLDGLTNALNTVSAIAYVMGYYTEQVVPRPLNITVKNGIPVQPDIPKRPKNWIAELYIEAPKKKYTTAFTPDDWETECKSGCLEIPRDMENDGRNIESVRLKKHEGLEEHKWGMDAINHFHPSFEDHYRYTVQGEGTELAIVSRLVMMRGHLEQMGFDLSHKYEELNLSTSKVKQAEGNIDEIIRDAIGR
jgi:hypothetical protein